MKAEPKKIDNAQTVFVDDPLYTEYNLSGVDDNAFVQLTTSGTVDIYCPSCESKSVFRIGDHSFYELSEEECRENFILRQKHEEDEYKIVLNTINKAHSR